MTGWGAEDRERVAKLELEELFPCLHPHARESHEIISVQEYLQSLGGRQHTQKGSSTGTQELRKIPETAWSRTLRRGTITHFDYVPDGLSSRGYILFVLHGLITDDMSPLKGVAFATYRRLGFAIWDTERLAALQLTDAPRTQEGVRTKRNSQYWFSWRSILNGTQIDDVVKRLADAEDDVTREGRLNLEKYGLEYFVRKYLFSESVHFLRTSRSQAIQNALSSHINQP